MEVMDLGVMGYREAWGVQEGVHLEVGGGRSGGKVLLVEHPAVITLGRRAEVSLSHLVGGEGELAARGVEVVESDRGGDITFHGVGQLVVYPVIRLGDFGLSVGGYVKLLQEGVVGVLGSFGVRGWLEEGAVGVWTTGPKGVSKVCAVGVRVKRGVTMHGLALNVTTDLSYFELIVPCGIAGKGVTSLAEVMGERCPSMAEVKARVVSVLVGRLESLRKIHRARRNAD